MPLAAHATGRAAMLFSSPGKKRSALRALAELDAILADPRVVTLRREIDAELGAVRGTYGLEQLWRAYHNDVAAYDSLLSTLVGGGGRVGEPQPRPGDSADRRSRPGRSEPFGRGARA